MTSMEHRPFLLADGTTYDEPLTERQRHWVQLAQRPATLDCTISDAWLTEVQRDALLRVTNDPTFMDNHRPSDWMRTQLRRGRAAGVVHTMRNNPFAVSAIQLAALGCFGAAVITSISPLPAALFFVATGWLVARDIQFNLAGLHQTGIVAMSAVAIAQLALTGWIVALAWGGGVTATASWTALGVVAVLALGDTSRRWVRRGTPEELLAALRRTLPETHLIASDDIDAGMAEHAEYLHRCAREPGRLARRLDVAGSVFSERKQLPALPHAALTATHAVAIVGALAVLASLLLK